MNALVAIAWVLTTLLYGEVMYVRGKRALADVLKSANERAKKLMEEESKHE